MHHMLVSPSAAWKLVLAWRSAPAIVVSAYARAPRRAFPARSCVGWCCSALGLYAVGLDWPRSPTTRSGRVWSMRPGSSCARWPRGCRAATTPRIRPEVEEPGDEHPPPGPDGLPEFDWAAFERRASARTRSASVSRPGIATGLTPPPLHGPSSSSVQAALPGQLGMECDREHVALSDRHRVAVDLASTSTSSPCSSTHGARMNTA